MMFLLIALSSFIFSESSLISLTDVSRLSIEQIKNEKTLVMIFQKDCSSCKKQVRELSCMEEDYSIKLIGVLGSEKELRKEYLRMKKVYPAYYGNSKALNELEITPSVTPQLITWYKGKIVSFIGYKTCREYKKLFKDVKNG